MICLVVQIISCFGSDYFDLICSVVKIFSGFGSDYMYVICLVVSDHFLASVQIILT